jgi:hypothetical protein
VPSGTLLTPRQRTGLLLGLWFGLASGLALALLLIELLAVRQGGHSTISELVWTQWAQQPWVIFLASHLVAMPTWFLAGHFLAQASAVYDRARGGSLQERRAQAVTGDDGP